MVFEQLCCLDSSKMSTGTCQIIQNQCIFRESDIMAGMIITSHQILVQGGNRYKKRKFKQVIQPPYSLDV